MGDAMWQFNWGIFWAVLAATGIVCFLIVGHVSQQIECLNKVLLDIELKLGQIRSDARANGTDGPL